MDVDVDEPGGDEQAVDEDRRLRLSCGNVSAHGGDLAVADTYVHRAVDVVGRIDHVTAFEQKVEIHTVWVSKVSGSCKTIPGGKIGNDEWGRRSG